MLTAPLVQAEPVQDNQQDAWACRGEKTVAHPPSVGFMFPMQSRSEDVSPPLQPHQHRSCVCHLTRNTEQNTDAKKPQRFGAHVQVADRAKLGCSSWVAAVTGVDQTELLQMFQLILASHLSADCLLGVGGEARTAGWVVCTQELVCGHVLP